jgi:hypothetical protein
MFMVQSMNVHLNAAPPKYFSYIDVLFIPSSYHSIKYKMLFYVINMKPGYMFGGTDLVSVSKLFTLLNYIFL